MPFDHAFFEPSTQGVSRAKSSGLLAAMKAAGRALLSPLPAMAAVVTLLIAPTLIAQISPPAPVFGTSDPWANSPWRVVRVGEPPNAVLTNVEFRWNKPPGIWGSQGCNIQVRNNGFWDITFSKLQYIIAGTDNSVLGVGNFSNFNQYHKSEDGSRIRIGGNGGMIEANDQIAFSSSSCPSVQNVFAFGASIEVTLKSEWSPWYPVHAGEPPYLTITGLDYRWKKSGQNACEVDFKSLRDSELSMNVSKMQVDIITPANKVVGIETVPGNLLQNCNSVNNVFFFNAREIPAKTNSVQAQPAASQSGVFAMAGQYSGYVERGGGHGGVNILVTGNRVRIDYYYEPGVLKPDLTFQGTINPAMIHNGEFDCTDTSDVKLSACPSIGPSGGTKIGDWRGESCYLSYLSPVEFGIGCENGGTRSFIDGSVRRGSLEENNKRPSPR